MVRPPQAMDEPASVQDYPVPVRGFGPFAELAAWPSAHMGSGVFFWDVVRLRPCNHISHFAILPPQGDLTDLQPFLFP